MTKSFSIGSGWSLDHTTERLCCGDDSAQLVWARVALAADGHSREHIAREAPSVTMSKRGPVNRAARPRRKSMPARVIGWMLTIFFVPADAA